MPTTKTKTPKLPDRLVLAADFQITCAADGGSEPKVPTFDMTAYTGVPMNLRYWDLPVVIDLAGMTIPSQTMPVRYVHDETKGVGHTESITNDGRSLKAKGIISRDTEEAREIVASSKKGFPWQASVSASADEVQFVDKGITVEANGRKVKGPCYVSRKSTLSEISFVDLGADTKTSARVAASAQETIPMSKKNEQNQEQPAPAEGATVEASKTEDELQAQAPAPPPPNPAEGIRIAAAAELKRIADIQAVCGSENADIAAKAIGENRTAEWAKDQIELKVLRASRPKAPAAHVPDNTLTARVIEAACLMTGKHSTVEKLYDEKTLEAANNRFHYRIGLQELLLEAAWANGYTGRTFRDTKDIMMSAFRPIQAGGFSTIDVTGILSNVANKFLLDGFMFVEQVWRMISAVRPVKDFKQVTSYRLVGTDEYQELGPGGEIKHGTLDEESYTNQAETVGLLLAITRKDMINDDIGALTTVPRRLGRGSGMKLNKEFWTEFLDNGSFFTTGSSTMPVNKITSATYALGLTGLEAAVTAFLTMLDKNGQPTGVSPKILLAPLGLNAMANSLFKSQEIRDTTSSNKYPVTNIHAGLYTPAISRYLSNSAYAGYSATSWYLLADPNECPVIEVCFLNGQEAPTIETADADFNALGIQMRGYHDFGIRKQDPKGGVKVTLS